ncbi:nuclear transport factor 2 family protein [bacterium]|nr:MAG: nuclear transport factor 2 family protein [bacterium]
MRKFKLPVIGLLLVLVGLFIWRVRQPALTDEQRIAAAMEGICAAASARSPRGIANHLAKEFRMGSMSKSEFQNSLAGGILQYRVIELKLTNPQVTVNGTSGTSNGNYTLSLKSEYNSPPQILSGKFDLTWKKIDGQWLVTKAEGELPTLP